MKQSMTHSSHTGEHLYAKFHQAFIHWMNRLVFIFVLTGLFSCSDFIDKPKNLVDKEVMAEIIADFTINEQATYMYLNKNMEAGTRFILKSHNVKPADFVDSFKYYVIKDQMDGIANDAKEILLKKDPKAEKYINDKLKKNGSIAPLVR